MAVEPHRVGSRLVDNILARSRLLFPYNSGCFELKLDGWSSDCVGDRLCSRSGSPPPLTALHRPPLLTLQS